MKGLCFTTEQGNYTFLAINEFILINLKKLIGAWHILFIIDLFY